MKYIIEINDEPFKNESLWGDNELYNAVGFNSLVFDRNGLEKLTPYDESEAEQRGREEAWELAQNILSPPYHSDVLTTEQIMTCYGTEDAFDVVCGMTYAEAREKYEAWKKSKDEIKVGDEVTDSEGIKAVVLDESASGESWGIFDENGLMRMINKSKVSKTGRHFIEVDELIEKMRKPEC